MFNVNDVIQKADLIAYVERAGGKLKKNGERYSCACPLHGGENITAFSIFPVNGKLLWHCFTGDCGSGDAISFVEKWQYSQEINPKERFKKACEFITGGKMADPEAMMISAEERLEAARIEATAAKEREDARRHELQTAQRHVQYFNNMKSNAWMRETWTNWGIDEGMQDFWKLGGCNDFFVDGEYHSPTLTIPVISPNMELMTIRHRIIKPRDPKDKYRPDRTGLHAHPFLALPEMGFSGGLVWVMEGEKKAMVTWTRSDVDWQCIGVPGQEMYKHLIDQLRPIGKRVIVVPDPGAEQKAWVMAKEIGARFLQLPQKIDDYILTINATQDDLFKLQKQARVAV